MDTAPILAFVADAQTGSIAVASAVTLLVFGIAAVKWLRRAK